MLAAIPLRIWLALGAVLAVAGLLWHDHHLSKLVKARNATIAAQSEVINGRDRLIAAIQADYKLSRSTSEALQKRLSDLERKPPISVLRCSASDLSRAFAQGRAAGGTDAGAHERVEGGADVSVDIAPGLNEYVRRCEGNAARQLTLQEWERARGH